MTYYCADCGGQSTTPNICSDCGAALVSSKPSASTPPAGAAAAVPFSGTSSVSIPPKCPRCGADTVEGVAFCEDCGTNLVTGEHLEVAPDMPLAPVIAPVFTPPANTRPIAPPASPPAADQDTSKASVQLTAVVRIDKTQCDPDDHDCPQLPTDTQDQHFPLTKTVNLIGRISASSPRPEIPIQHEDNSVSRKHAEIYLDGDTWRIRDVGSMNGTTVNGAKVPCYRKDPATGQEKWFEVDAQGNEVDLAVTEGPAITPGEVVHLGYRWSVVLIEQS